MNIDELKRKSINGEKLTRAERIFHDKHHRRDEVDEYDFQIELLQDQLSILDDDPTAETEHKKRIQSLIQQNIAQRRIAHTALLALERAWDRVTTNNDGV